MFLSTSFRPALSSLTTAIFNSNTITINFIVEKEYTSQLCKHLQVKCKTQNASATFFLTHPGVNNSPGLSMIAALTVVRSGAVIHPKTQMEVMKCVFKIF